MEPEQFLLLGAILLAGALLVVGGAFLGLRARRQSDNADPLKPASAETPFPATANELSRSKREPPTWLSDWQRKLPPDTILVSRDPSTREWSVEVEGQRYRRLGDVHDDKAAKKILSAIEGLKMFAGITPTAPAPEPASPPIAPLPATTLTPASNSATYVARRSRQAIYPAPEGSIIAQIETILQRELTLQPDLSQRSIHMGAQPDGSLLIEVDLNFYKSPDEIPDPRVRDLVMLAVRTWEKSS